MDALIRCMGGKSCKHQPGTCTATNKQYQEAIADRLRARPCTCHPDEAPTPCPKKYAISECRIAALEAEVSALRAERDAIEARTIEECAKVAHHYDITVACADIAAAIRALGNSDGQ